jgi:hypothetical protein
MIKKICDSRQIKNKDFKQQTVVFQFYTLKYLVKTKYLELA